MVIRVFRYCVSGGVSAVLSFVISFAVYHWGGVQYLEAQALGFVVGAALNFPLNRIWTFQNRYKNVGRQFGVFLGVALIGFGLNELSLRLAVSLANLWVPLAMVIGIGIGFLWNFSANNWFTFGKLGSTR